MKIVLLVLALLLMTSSASAVTDAPDFVLIDVDLHWTVPVYGAIRLFGSEEWQNGVGYTENPKSASDRWHVTGIPCVICVWVNLAASSFPTQFVLDLEDLEPHGIPHFSVSFDGHLLNPVVQPGEYDIGGALFSDPGLGICCPLPHFVAESGHLTVAAVPEPVGVMVLGLILLPLVWAWRTR